MMREREKKKLEQDSKRELRAIVMVISNSLLNFCLRLPEILVFISSLTFYFIESEDVDTQNNQSANFNSQLVDISYLTFILTFSTNVAIFFFLFNTKLKQAFKLWSNVKEKVGTEIIQQELFVKFERD
jgi:hypothetical protein